MDNRSSPPHRRRVHRHRQVVLARMERPMSDIKVHHLSPQEFVEFELNSRDTMRIRVAYLGQVPDTDKASIGIEITYASELENKKDK